MKNLLAVFCFLPLASFAQLALTGSILDKDAQPLSGVTITLLPPDIQIQSSEDGMFSFVGLEPGDFTLWCEHDQLERSYQISLNRDTFLQLGLLRQIMVEEVIVSSVRAGRDNPMTFVNYRQEEIESLDKAQDVPYALRWSPSAIVTSDAGTGIGYTGIRIRGSDPTRINVTINGIPLNDAESQGVYWVDLPDILSSASDIQVQRGVGTSTNGSGAFGASINVNTNQLNPEAYVRVEGLAGSFGSAKGSLNFGSGLIKERLALDGRISFIGSDGYIDRARADLQSYYLSAAYLDVSQSFRLNVFSGKEVTYQAWNGVPADSLASRESRTYNSAGAERPGEPYDNEVDDYKQTHFQAFYNRSLGVDLHLGLAAHYTTGEGFFEQYKASQDLGNYFSEGFSPPDPVFSDLVRRRWLDNDYYGLIGSLRWEPGSSKRWEVHLSAGYSIYEGRHFGEVIWTQSGVDIPDGHTYYDNTAEKHDWNTYGKAIYRLSDKIVMYGDLQLRGVQYSFLGLDEHIQPLEEEVSHTFFNPKFGLSLRTGQGGTLTASFGVGSKEPNRDDYVSSSPLSRPAPEKLYNTEAGYSIPLGKKARLIGNVYYMYYRDQLVLTGQINDVGDYTRTNADKSYRLGLEAGATYALSSHIDLQTNVTLSRNRILDYVEYVDLYNSSFEYLGQERIDRGNSDLAFSPSFQGDLQLNIRLLEKKLHAIRLGLKSKYVGKQYVDNSSDENNALDPYHFLDAEISYRLLPGWIKELNLYVGIHNLTDQLYESNAWSYRFKFDGQELTDNGYYPQAGRNFYVRVAVDL